MLDKGYMLTHNDPKSPIAEAYRIMRRNIQFSGVDYPIKTIIITSAGPGEGKTTTTMNLGIAFAQSGSKVLIMDADLRMPTIHKTLNLPNDYGMSNVLAQQQNYTYSITNKIMENFSVLTAGPVIQNPSEYFTSNAMRNLIENAKQDFDIILIDAPPIGIVTDVAVLSTIVDGTILIAASGEVKRASMIRAKELLERVKANIIGVVLNKIPGTDEGNKHNIHSKSYKEKNIKMVIKRFLRFKR